MLLEKKLVEEGLLRFVFRHPAKDALIMTPEMLPDTFNLVTLHSTEYDTIKGMRLLTHTRTGNVYGSGQGDVRLKSNGHPEGLEQGHSGGAFPVGYRRGAGSFIRQDSQEAWRRRTVIGGAY